MLTLRSALNCECTTNFGGLNCESTKNGMQPGRTEEGLNGRDLKNVIMETAVVFDFTTRQCACSRRACNTPACRCEYRPLVHWQFCISYRRKLATFNVSCRSTRASMRNQALPLAALLAVLALCCHSQALYPPPEATDIGVVLF